MEGVPAGFGPAAGAAGAASADARKALALIAAGSVVWLVHGLLVLVGVVSILTIGLSGLANLQVVFAAAYALLVAVAAVAVAALLVGVALIRAKKGAAPEAGGKVLLAGVLLLAYAATAIVAFVAALMAAGWFGSYDIPTFFMLISLILAAWAVSAIVLAIAGFVVPAASRGLRFESRGKPVLGKLFLAFAIVNAVGVLMLTLPALASGLGAGLESLAIVAALGLLLSLLAAPALAIAVFALGLRSALAARTAAPPVAGP